MNKPPELPNLLPNMPPNPAPASRPPSPQPPQRGLAHSEKTLHLWSSERSRDKAQAKRDIENLEIADQQLHYLRYMAEAMPALINEQRETNRLLSIIAEQLSTDPRRPAAQ